MPMVSFRNSSFIPEFKPAAMAKPNVDVADSPTRNKKAPEKSRALSWSG